MKWRTRGEYNPVSAAALSETFRVEGQLKTFCDQKTLRGYPILHGRVSTGGGFGRRFEEENFQLKDSWRGNKQLRSTSLQVFSLLAEGRKSDADVKNLVWEHVLILCVDVYTTSFNVTDVMPRCSNDQSKRSCMSSPFFFFFNLILNPLIKAEYLYI